MSIKSRDKVIVIAGKDTGKQGIVKKVYTKTSRALVENVNFIKRHIDKKMDGVKKGFEEKESPIHLSNIMLFCEKCSRPTKVSINKLSDGKKIRVCKKCGENII